MSTNKMTSKAAARIQRATAIKSGSVPKKSFSARASSTAAKNKK